MPESNIRTVFAMPEGSPTEDLAKLAKDVFTNGWETGVAYWINAEDDILSAGVHRDSAGEVDVASFTFRGEPGTDGYTAQVIKTIDLRDILEAMCKIASGDTRVNQHIEGIVRDQLVNADYCGTTTPGGDANTDDVIIQVALFGAVIYG